jgi:hypothetical protein
MLIQMDRDRAGGGSSKLNRCHYYGWMIWPAPNATMAKCQSGQENENIEGIKSEQHWQTRQVFLSVTLSHGESLSLTRNRGLHKHVKVPPGRMNRPIMCNRLQGHQPFAFNIHLAFELGKRLIIVRISDSDVDLCVAG